MATELFIALGVVVVAIVALGAKLRPKRMPPVAVFQCTRCGTATRHSDRTAEAWRMGKTTFFCHACHAKWLASRPDRAAHADRGAKSSSGCLGVVVLFALLPAGSLLTWAYA